MSTPRTGITTGSCAALAAGVAARMLLTGEAVAEAAIVTPGGARISAQLRDVSVGDGLAACSVVKDAGDDPDATDGVSVRVTARRAPDGRGVGIDGGEGVGRVTRAGLDQPVGAAAINSVPRRQIGDAVRAACRELGHDPDAPGGGIDVVVAIPGGEEIAARTFNPRLGIVGGLSVIGTTGIVEPMSSRAFAGALRAELAMHRAAGADGVVLTPGNYGEAFLREHPGLALRPCAACANFVGEALDAAAELGFSGVLLVGHFGKFVKLAGGVMDTHSRAADCRTELLALGAALAGADAALVRRVLDAATVDEGLDALDEKTRAAAVEELLARAETYCSLRTAGRAGIGVAAFTNRFGLLGISAGAEELLARWEKGGGRE